MWKKPIKFGYNSVTIKTEQYGYNLLPQMWRTS